jgi:hypothetical protein
MLQVGSIPNLSGLFETVNMLEETLTINRATHGYLNMIYHVVQMNRLLLIEAFIFLHVSVGSRFFQPFSCHSTHVGKNKRSKSSQQNTMKMISK